MLWKLSSKLMTIALCGGNLPRAENGRSTICDYWEHKACRPTVANRPWGVIRL